MQKKKKPKTKQTKNRRIRNIGSAEAGGGRCTFVNRVVRVDLSKKEGLSTDLREWGNEPHGNLGEDDSRQRKLTAKFLREVYTCNV